LKLRIRTLPAIAIAALLLLPVAAAQMPPHLTPFSADMEFSSARGAAASHDMAGKIYVNPDHMRMDMNTGPRGGAIVITNLATRTTDTIMPDQHMYMEFTADQAMAMRRGMGPNIKPFTDPGNPCANQEGWTCKNLGVEQVNGRSADHWQITDKNGKVTNAWVDQKIHFPIKSVTQDGSTWQLSNIQEGEQPPSLFEIPAGYQKMDMGQMMQGMQGMRPPQQ
jgi:hypothetical protein